MAAVIANEFAEAADLQLSSLILVGLLLFLVTFVVNLACQVDALQDGQERLPGDVTR